MDAPPPRLPWYRLPVRIPLWFALVLVAGWAIVTWRGLVVSVAPPAAAAALPPNASLVCREGRVNPYRTDTTAPGRVLECDEIPAPIPMVAPAAR